MFVEFVDVWGIKHAIRGMRNPLESWDKSDSIGNNIGEKDMELACKLIKAGTEHRKFLRQIYISMDIVAPRFWWLQFDTYKINVTSNSTSTMHNIHKRKIERNDFEIDSFSFPYFFDKLIDELNENREAYLATKNKLYWDRLIQLLPQSYIQRRTVTFSYETALNIILQRRGHKVKHWEYFICKLLELPYMEYFCRALLED